MTPYKHWQKARANMDINREYMLVVMDKLKQDIKAKEYDYGCNGAKVDIALGSKEVDILIMALDGTFDKLDRESEEK